MPPVDGLYRGMSGEPGFISLLGGRSRGEAVSTRLRDGRSGAAGMVARAENDESPPERALDPS